jgi:hypothetical protein
MKRSWINAVATLLAVVFGTAGTALAGHGGGGGGGHSGGGGSARSFSGGSGNVVRQSSFNAPVHNNVSPLKVGSSAGAGSIKPTGPVSPTHTINPGNLKVGTGSQTAGNGKLKLPPGSIGPGGAGKGPVAGTGGGAGGGGQPGGGSGGSGGGNNGNCHKGCFPPIVIGCLPCGGYYGGYYPPVYTQPVYTQPAVVEVTNVINEVPAPVAATAATTIESPATTTEAPAAAGSKFPQVPVGSTLTLQAKDLGHANGQVLLVMDKLTMGMQINEWSNDYATATLPLIGVTGRTESEIVVVKADGHAASSVKVELVPAQQQAAATAESVASVAR